MGIFRRNKKTFYHQAGILLFFAFTFLHQQNLVNGNENPVGLGDSFQPSVKASCVGSKMTIRVDTKEPFEGIIHGPNRTDERCSVLGKGGLKTRLVINLGVDGECGVKYNARTEERKVAIAVRAHPTIELLEDRLYVVSCGRQGYQNSRNEVSVVQLKVSLPGDTSNRKVDAVLEGSEYRLRVEVLDHDSQFGILVRRCFAFDETDSSVQLVDDRGCTVERLISNFEYDHEKGSADATIYSMFRLPHSNRTYFQCEVAICRGECSQPQCDKVTSAVKNNPLKTLTQDTAPEDNAVTTSTSVFVAQPGSESSVNAAYCNGGGFLGGDDGEYLKWLCIAFGVLFGIMLLINIFLCSAMTCSCTKSEIIEKEPSIYDDYSLYESQYGYTNGKVYGSESDYGSEYGTVERAGGRHHIENDVDDDDVPSESGTYHSKYSQQQQHHSTLNRNSRH